MEDAKSAATPLIQNKRLIPRAPEDTRNVDIKHYMSMIGSLMYAAQVGRPDLVHSVHQLARFMSNPSKEHVAAARHVIRYLVGNSRRSLIFRKSAPLILEGFTDSDWAGDPTSRKSTSGFCFRLDPTSAAICWSSRMQRSTALSSCEAEFYAASLSVQEAIWLRALVRDFGHDNKKRRW